MARIDISGLDKAAVVAALYNASKQQGFGVRHSRGAEEMTVEQARQYMQHGQTDTERMFGITSHGDKPRDPVEGLLSFDYLYGRVMKVNLEGDDFDPWGYDRDNGEGAAQAAIDSLR